MRRLFVTNLLFVIAVNALVKPAYVLWVDRLVQIRIGPNTYGMYQALVNLGLIFNVLLDFGLANYNVRLVAAAPEKLPERLPSLLTARVVLSLTFSIVVFTTAYILGYRGNHLALLAGILGIQSLAQAHLFFRSCLSGLHRFKADSLLSITDRLLMLILCSILLTYPAFSLRWFVGAQIFCYTAALFTGMYLVRRYSPVRFRFSFNLRPVWTAIWESAPYALITFLMSVYLRADTMLIERLAGATEAGRYAAAYRLLDIGHMFGLTFASLLLPLFGKLMAEKKSVHTLVVTSASLLLPMSLIVAAAGLFYAEPLMVLLYGSNGHSEAPIFQVLMVAFPAFCLTNIYSTLLTASGRLSVMNRIAAVVCVISLAANLFLISRYKSLGGAWATFITQWVVSLAYVFYASRIARLPFTKSWVLRMLLYAGLAVAFGYASSLLPMPWPVQLSVMSVALTGLLFALRLVSIASIKQLTAR